MSEIYQPADDSYLLSTVLAEMIPKLFSKNKDLKFLEIGCGSGIQLETALNSGVKKENILGADINEDAVEHCKRLGFNCVISDLFNNIKGTFDIIIFNPPYLPEDKREPKPSQIATTGGKRGGELINKFLKQTRKHLNNGGRIFLLTSSLTKGVDFSSYHKKALSEKNLFFEKLKVVELTLSNKN